ncbi:MAG: hypothetical protein AUH44_01700 [Chloroflexi bacterium 13_1_40CM_68_15]|nr:MAG: hypothetical protein AUH44_01700 [Chloroflexi bacterium 13_1_40CM_68_15]
MPIEVAIAQKLVQCAAQLPARCRARRYAGDTFGKRFHKATVIGPGPPRPAARRGIERATACQKVAARVHGRRP